MPGAVSQSQFPSTTRTLYVSSSGNDTSAIVGRRDKPYLTIASAYAEAADAPGTTINIGPGVWTETGFTAGRIEGGLARTIASGSRTSNVVTLVTSLLDDEQPHNLSVGDEIAVSLSVDPGARKVAGLYRVATVPNTHTLTFVQAGPDETFTGITGFVSGCLTFHFEAGAVMSIAAGTAMFTEPQEGVFWNGWIRITGYPVFLGPAIHFTGAARIDAFIPHMSTTTTGSACIEMFGDGGSAELNLVFGDAISAGYDCFVLGGIGKINIRGHSLWSKNNGNALEVSGTSAGHIDVQYIRSDGTANDESCLHISQSGTLIVRCQEMLADRACIYTHLTGRLVVDVQEAVCTAGPALLTGSSVGTGATVVRNGRLESQLNNVDGPAVRSTNAEAITLENVTLVVHANAADAIAASAARSIKCNNVRDPGSKGKNANVTITVDTVLTAG